jgi:hypothetical protein
MIWVYFAKELVVVYVLLIFLKSELMLKSILVMVVLSYKLVVLSYSKMMR